MNEEALIELLKSSGVSDEKIATIVDEISFAEEEKEESQVSVQNPEQVIALIDLQMLYETDWRKRAALAMKKISLRLSE